MDAARKDGLDGDVVVRASSGGLPHGRASLAVPVNSSRQVVSQSEGKASGR